MDKKQEKYTLINKSTMVYIINTLFLVNIKIKNALHKLDTSVCISSQGITPTPVGVPFEVYSFNNNN